MKKNILLTFFILITSVAFSQRMKYSDLVLTFSGMGDEEVRNELKDYNVADNKEPNVYFRLALIYEKAYTKVDPLTDYKLPFQMPMRLV